MFISPPPDAVGRSGRVTRTQDSIAAALRVKVKWDAGPSTVVDLSDINNVLESLDLVNCLDLTIPEPL